MEKVRIRKIIEDIIITQFLNSEMDIVHEEDVSFKELGLDSIDRIELDAMVEQKFNIVIIDYDTESIKDILEVNKAEAERMEEVGKNKAEADKEAAIAIQDSEAQIKKAEAEKNASIGYNNAQKEVAVSVSELQIIKAQSEKKAGEEKVKSEAAVKTAKELADKEVEEAKAKKVQAALKAEKIVPAETQKEEAILQADAEAEKIKRRAEAEAAAHLAKAEAEAKAIQMKLEAEAEGKKKSLMAEADGFKAMVEAAESNPQIAIQYKMVNQWKEIAGEQVKAFEHINLGNITVFDGGQNSTGNFLNNVVKTVAPALGVIDQLPIADTLKKLKGDDKKINTMAQGYTWA